MIFSAPIELLYRLCHFECYLRTELKSVDKFHAIVNTDDSYLCVLISIKQFFKSQGRF